MARPIPRFAPVTTATGRVPSLTCWDTALLPDRPPRCDRPHRSWGDQTPRSMGKGPKICRVLRVDPSTHAAGALDVTHGERQLELHPGGGGAQVPLQQLLGPGEPVGHGV